LGGTTGCEAFGFELEHYPTQGLYPMNTLVAIALGSIIAAPVPKDAPKQTESFEGEWVLIAIVHEGKRLDMKPGVVTFKDRVYTLSYGPDNPENELVTFTFDPKANPMTIDFTPQGENLVIKGIYKIEKDKLTICFGMDGTDRPKEFKSEADSRTGLIIVERKKK
jgi:uncharacterized protein (TIGR03067 family)